MKKRGLATRIIAIFLCALMVLSVVAVALTRVFAYDGAEYVAVETGSDSRVLIFAVAAIIAVIVAVVCVVTMNKKKK